MLRLLGHLGANTVFLCLKISKLSFSWSESGSLALYLLKNFSVNRAYGVILTTIIFFLANDELFLDEKHFFKQVLAAAYLCIYLSQNFVDNPSDLRVFFVSRLLLKHQNLVLRDYVYNLVFQFFYMIDKAVLEVL
jgi:hypothetical protein